MRRKHLARVGRTPANDQTLGGGFAAAPHPAEGARRPELRPRTGGCARKDPPVPPAGRHAAAPLDDDPTGPDRPGYHDGVPCAACARKETAARLHRDRQLWILARELCASATLQGAGGHPPDADRTLELACVMLRDRVGTLEPTAPRD